MPTLFDIARALGVELPSDAADRPLTRVTTLEKAAAEDVAYITSDRYADRLTESAAGVVIVSAKVKLPHTSAIVLRVPDAELAIATVLALFEPPRVKPAVGVHPSAVIAHDAKLGEGAAVGPHVSVGPGTVIGRNVVLHAGVVIGNDCVVGDDCELFPGVVLRERVTLGSRVMIHANSTIGTDGFGYRWNGKQHVKVPQIGTVVIEDDVEVGSSTCIDRAKFGETRIGRGTKIDNLVQVGHNVTVGPHCILCGGVALAGSSTLGAGVVMGGGSAAADHQTIADGVTLAARAAVAGKTERGQILAGAPAVPHRDWLKQQVLINRLPELAETVRKLEAEIERLKASAST